MAARPKEEVLAPTESSPDGRYTRVRGTACACSFPSCGSNFLCSAGLSCSSARDGQQMQYVCLETIHVVQVASTQSPSAGDTCGYNLAVCELSPWCWMRQRGAEDAAGVQQVSTAQNWQQSGALQQSWKDCVCGHVCAPQGIGGMRPDVCVYARRCAPCGSKRSEATHKTV